MKKKKVGSYKKYTLFLLSLVILFVVSLLLINPKVLNKISNRPINTMLMLIEFESIDGILQWEKQLDARNLTALVKVQDNVLKENQEVFKRLADKGYEIAGGYDKAAFWDMTYDDQYKYLKEAKETVKSITGKEMRVFGSRYFAYDETTLKAADALGIPFILGRGTQDVEAVIYQPQEYKAKVISVTNVDVGEPMGRGSLCDYSLWARGSDAIEFGKILEESIAKKPDNMIIVSHAYLGGTRLEWWQEYEKVLCLKDLYWVGFDNWLKSQKIITLPNAKIPLNNEVKYVTPIPAKPMEDYDPIPGIGESNGDEVTGEDALCL
jgi:hypothetical protein